MFGSGMVVERHKHMTSNPKRGQPKAALQTQELPLFSGDESRLESFMFLLVLVCPQ